MLRPVMLQPKDTQAMAGHKVGMYEEELTHG